jgi:hypothetical protein
LDLKRHHLSLALHPGSLAIYLKSGRFLEAGDMVPLPLRKLPVDLPGLAELASRGEPWDITPAARYIRGKERICRSGL